MTRLNRSLLRLGQALHARAYRFTSVTPLTQRRVNQRPENARAKDLAGHTMPVSVAEAWNVKGYANNAWHRVPVQVAG